MKAVRLCAVASIGLAMAGCTPGFFKESSSQVVLLMTAINGGTPIQSDVELSTGGVCADFVGLRLENHFKNPSVTGTGFRHDIVVERYEIHYVRSDGRNTQGVDVPFSVTGNVAQEVIEDQTATLFLEVVRIQAKLEPPLRNLRDLGGALVITMFADVTLHARTTTREVLAPVTARVQVDFADFADDEDSCPAPPTP